MLINNPDKEIKNLPICDCGKTQNKPYCDGSCDHVEAIKDPKDTQK